MENSVQHFCVLSQNDTEAACSCGRCQPVQHGAGAPGVAALLGGGEPSRWSYAEVFPTGEGKQKATELAC